MNRTIVKFALTALATLAMMLPVNAFADAGKAIFVYGKAFAVSADGDRRALTTGSAVSSGETVITSSNGRIQLQMADGGLLALRPGTEFLIESFVLPEETTSTEALFAEAEPRSFFVLVKGGLRSITGAIGKENKANYRLKTPVATIGIRGTDYDVVFCAGNCQAYSEALGRSVEDGLYVGVNSGGVRLATDVGTLDLDMGEFGFTPDATTAPRRSGAAEEMLAPGTTAAVNQNPVDDSTVADAEPDSGLEAQDQAGNSENLVDGGNDVAQTLQGALTVSSVPSETGTFVSPSETANVVRDANNDVVGFSTADDSFALEGGSPVNVGRDADRENATGLSWGRWDEGNVVSSTGTSTIIENSVHYVVGEEGAAAPVLPTTGSANFELIGNTDPTDNRGNVGALGSAELSADFTNQTVDADVSLSFQETSEVWAASAEDVDINSADATFAGDFDQVTVAGPDGTSDGTGDLSGFFTGDQNGDVNGAGMSFTLNEGEVEVDGSAAFQTSD